MLRTIIVDDEALSRKHFKHIAEQVGGMLLVGEAVNVVEARELYQRLQPEVIILDIRLPGTSGLDWARELSELPCPPAVIFSSAYESHALEAFRSGGDGYLLKPVRPDLLRDALAKVSKGSRALRSAAVPNGERRFLTIKSRRGLTVLPIEDVRYFYADQKYVMAVTEDGERVLDEALRHLETEYSDALLRVHRNALVTIEHVMGLKRLNSGQYQVELQGIEGGPVVSRRHLSEVRKRLSSM